jgi:hypothetical protein
MDEDIEILYQEESGFVGLSWSKELDSYLMHTDVTIWSVSEYKRYIEIFGKILDGLYQRGIKEVYGVCDTQKELKFNELFGFKYTGIMTTDVEGTESYLSRLEI